MGFRDQLASQGQTLADARAAEAELRRVVADKAGLADLQALLHSQSSVPVLPVRKPCPVLHLDRASAPAD